MDRVIILLICLIFTIHGCRIQSWTQKYQKTSIQALHEKLMTIDAAHREQSGREPGKIKAPKALVMSLLAFNPATAFNPALPGPRAPLDRRSGTASRLTVHPGLHHAFGRQAFAPLMSATSDTLQKDTMDRAASSETFEGTGTAPTQAADAADAGTAIVEVGDGVVLVTGGTLGLGREFIKATFGQVAEQHRFAQPGVALTSAEQVDSLLSEVERLHPGRPIIGLVHFGQGQADIEADLGSSPTRGAEVVDNELRSLVLLVGRLVPKMRLAGTQCRILSVSTGIATASPSEWYKGDGMKALLKGFVEQYTEALAEELRDSNIAVYCMRIAGPDIGEEAFTEFRDAWELPAMEAQGRILDIDGRAAERAASAARGGSVIGPSVDSKWALRAAAGQAGDYPANFSPRAYRELADAMGIPVRSLVWFHGASDVIVRVAVLAAARARDLASGSTSRSKKDEVLKAFVQKPSWDNAAYLIQSGGLEKIVKIPYADPWMGADTCETFWQTLEASINRDPPALVYLVDPHFPTGHKCDGMTQRLRRLVERTKGEVVFIVDQTYLGFMEETEDDRECESLALETDAVVLVRSLSKVQGLAAVRLGYAVASEKTAAELKSALPFEGALYISELALDGALAAVCGKSAQCHRDFVLDFYKSEKDWFAKQLADQGLHVSPSNVTSFFVVRGPSEVIDTAFNAGAVFQRFDFPAATKDEAKRTGRQPGDSFAVALVSNRATNTETVEAVRQGFQKLAMRETIEQTKRLVGKELVQRSQETGLVELDDDVVSREAEFLAAKFSATPPLQVPHRPPGATRLILVNQARTPCDKLMITRGRGLDDALDAVGRLEARRVGEALYDVEIDAVFASTLRRARETASVAISNMADKASELLPTLETNALASLDEMDFGELEGTKALGFQARFAMAQGMWKLAPDRPIADGGESLKAVKDRATKALEALLGSVPATGGTVLAVSHEVLLSQLLEIALGASSKKMKSSGISVLDFEGGKARSVVINSVAHIYDPEDEY